MTNSIAKLPIIVSERERPFTTYPVAIQVILMDNQQRILLLSSPRRNRPNEWQVISGGLEANETVLDGARRETGEEAGPDVRVRPLGVLHVQTFKYDRRIPYMLGVYYLMAYEGGEVVPGDDMVGSAYRWWSIDKLRESAILYHPSTMLWLLERATAVYPLWHNHTNPLQPPLESP